MGQKVHPTGFRVGVMEDWRSRWYASKHEFSDLLVEDFKIRALSRRSTDSPESPGSRSSGLAMRSSSCCRPLVPA